MKKCKDSKKYNGKGLPPCILFFDGPCDMCNKKFIECCPHKLYDLKLIDNQLICSRCTKQIDKSIDFLYEKLFELKDNVQEN